MKTEIISIAVVDDCKSHVQKIISCIDGHTKYIVTSTHHSGADFLMFLAAQKKAQQPLPQIVLLDYDMMHIDGPCVCDYLTIFNVPIYKIACSGNNEVHQVYGMFAAGVNAYLTKQYLIDASKNSVYNTNTFIEAFDTVLAGNTYFDIALKILWGKNPTDILNIEHAKQNRKDSFKYLLTYKITASEFKVLFLKAVGCCNKNIACICEVEIKTIDNQIASLSKKINIEDTKELVQFALRTVLVRLAKMYIQEKYEYGYVI